MFSFRKPHSADHGEPDQHRLRLASDRVDLRSPFRANSLRPDTAAPAVLIEAAKPGTFQVLETAASPRDRDYPRMAAGVPSTDHHARSRSIAICSHVMGVARDTAAGILLSQLIYWTRRGVETAERQGWIFKTASEWQQETGMTWKVQRRARDHLIKLRLIEERRQKMPARLEFRLKLGELGQHLAERSEVGIGVVGRLDLASFTDMESAVIDRLLGKAFLYHSALARVFPVNTAMLCSRLIAGVKAPMPGPAWGEARSRERQLTRLVTMQRHQWRVETGLTRDEWQTARRNLTEAGILVVRRHNFPRRIDLAIDMSALAELLKYGPAQRQVADPGEAGWDRAKQVGGIGHRPFPPSQSPDPADKDRPIPPIRTSQSHLYYGLDDIERPQPQGAGTRGIAQSLPAIQSFGCGGGGEKGYGTQSLAVGELPSWPGSTTPLQASITEPATRAPADGIALGTLVWPSVFEDGDRPHAAKYLAGLDRAIQQQILDEIAWQHSSGKQVRSPVALARTLCKHAVAGTFMPDGGHRVASSRARAAEAAIRNQAEAERRAAQAQQAEAPGPVIDTRDPAVVERMKRVREQITGERAA